MNSFLLQWGRCFGLLWVLLVSTIPLARAQKASPATAQATAHTTLKTLEQKHFYRSLFQKFWKPANKTNEQIIRTQEARNLFKKYYKSCGLPVPPSPKPNNSQAISLITHPKADHTSNNLAPAVCFFLTCVDHDTQLGGDLRNYYGLRLKKDLIVRQERGWLSFCSSSPNPQLDAQIQTAQDKLYANPLYQQGRHLASDTQLLINKADSYCSCYDREGSYDYKVEFWRTVREYSRLQSIQDHLRSALFLPPSPAPLEKIGAGTVGVAASVADTVVAVPKLVYRCGKSVYYLRDETGITQACRAFWAFLTRTPEEIYAAELAEAQQGAWNGHEYGLKQAKSTGYCVTEVVTFCVGGEILKGVRGLVRVEKVVELSQEIKLLGPAGDPGARFINVAPKNWIVKTAKNGKGTRYINPHNSHDYIRFSAPNMDPLAPLGQKLPYFQRVKNGKYLTKTGEWVVKTAKNKEAWHIPQSMFDTLGSFLNFK